jgi:hypothetical protein
METAPRRDWCTRHRDRFICADGTGANNLYAKTTGVTVNTGWESYTTSPLGPGTTYRKTTSKAVNTTVAATDLLNGEIALDAGVMGTSGRLYAKLWGDFLNSTGSAQKGPQFQLVIGGTTVLDIGQATITLGTNASRASWGVVIEALELGATNSQVWSIGGYVYGPNATSANGFLPFVTGTGKTVWESEAEITFKGGDVSAIDMTIARNFVFNVINGVSNASYETRLFGAFVEIV